jgi:phosphomannomutase / phosphoglucomutase
MRPVSSLGLTDPDRLDIPVIAPSGFREYDARWRFPDQINLAGMTAVGLGIGTQMRRRDIRPDIVVGNDYRDYAPAVKNALILGLMRAGIRVHDIGTCLSPTAYFAQFHLDVPAVAMITASHNPNGWTGVKVGFDRPVTHGPDEMRELREIVLTGAQEEREGGSYRFRGEVRDAYLDDLVGGFRLSRPLRVVCATGNGTAGLFAPRLLERIGAEVIPLHVELDHRFPHYNPNPEALEMLHDMGRVVRETGADLALGFDGDGDRCGVVDDEAEEIFADKMGLLLARDLAARHPGALFVADVKSTGLFRTDPALQELGARCEYWKTGHSHMKRRVRELGALAGFEKSGHYFLSGEVGLGYDCGMRVAVEICRLLDRNPGRSLSDLKRDLPLTFTTPTLSPACPDEEKYGLVDRVTGRLESLLASGGLIAGRRITGLLTVNGVRVELENGAWGLVRASSNTPNLVIVCESPEGVGELRRIRDALDALIRSEGEIGVYDQDL